MDSQPEFFEEFPQDPSPNREFVRLDRKIIPVSFWKDGRIRADLSKYGKGVLVSRNRINLARRIREICADLECVATDVESSAEPAQRVRNRRPPEINPLPPEDIEFVRPADYG